MNKLTLTLVVLALCASSFAQRAEGNGNELLERCNAAINFIDAPTTVTHQQAEMGMTCLGFLRGIMDVVGLWQTADDMYRNRVSPARPCLPERIATIQGVRVVVKYLKDHPEQLHQPDTLLVMTALNKAFPCPAKE